MNENSRRPDTAEADSLWEQFAAPQQSCRPMPKWVWNADLDAITEEAVREQFRAFRDHDGFGGVMIVLWGRPGYMSEEFYRKYGMALDIAAQERLHIILWDENGFPTGYAGGLFEQRYPELTARRLERAVVDAPSGDVELALPEGKLMAAVAVERDTLQRIDVAGGAHEGVLHCNLPQGCWQVQLFHTVREQAFDLMGCTARFMDYLSAEAVSAFVQMTHQQYYERFPQHFGTTIRHAFYDEPSFWRLQGRIWTDGFNEEFRRRHGYGPELLYPALWQDIGPDTAAARHALLGLRAQLYADNFVGTLADWCAGHGIALTGHMDQEEIANPVPLSGDLMKVFHSQHMPGVDEIFRYGRGSRGYKVVTSAAFNYDKPAVMCECYGAMGEDMPADVLYREVLDLYAKGVNFLVPHGTWFDAVNNVIFPPELSYRSKKYGPELPAHSTYAARLSALLQGGVHVADIAVLYPIEALQAGNVFGAGDAYLGANIAPGTNYMELGEALSLQVRRDFTYLHPEVFLERCTLEGDEIALQNQVNRERFRVLVISSAEIIDADVAAKSRAFYDGGGCVLCVGQVPCRSTQFGRDSDVMAAMEAIFGSPVEAGIVRRHPNGRGGMSCALARLDDEALRAALDTLLPVADVAFAGDIRTNGGNLSYIHKRRGDAHIYFVANSSDNPVRMTVRLRAALQPEIWDPALCCRSVADSFQLQSGEETVTEVPLELPAVHGVVLVAFTQGISDSVDRTDKLC